MKSSIYLLPALLLTMAISACHKDQLFNVSKGIIVPSQPITSDTLSGSVKGTMLSGKTYYFKSDITVNAGDTLQMQAGVKLIALGDGLTYQTSPEILIHGTFISLGTKDQPNYITIPDSLHNAANAYKGMWGGLQAFPKDTTEKGGDMVIKWTHVEYAGGPASGSDIGGPYKAGDPRYIIYFGNLNKNFVLEDSWISYSKDDAIRTGGGHISVMRNTFEGTGEKGGESLNIKSGTVGDVAYNVCIGGATNGLKVANTSTTTIQAQINIYNNTLINCGYRQTKSGRGGSINYEQGGKGNIYNNLIVNCRFGFRLVKDADTLNIRYNNQYYYAQDAQLATQFSPSDGVAAVASGDVRGDAKANDPLFINYDVNQFDYTPYTGAMTLAQQQWNLLSQGSWNFRLKSGSPAAGKGKTDFSPLNNVTLTGALSANVTPPGKDLGAYQIDGTGNQH